MSPQDVTVVLNYTFDFCLYVTEKYLDNSFHAIRKITEFLTYKAKNPNNALYFINQQYINTYDIHIYLCYK